MKTFLLIFFFVSSVQARTHVFADRYYLSSVLEYVFGPQAKKVITQNILMNGNVFGGPCDVYEQIRVGKNEFANPETTRCFRGKQEFNYPVHAKPSLMREALMIKTCRALVENDHTFQFAKKRAGEFDSINESYVQRIESLFDPNFKIDEVRTNENLKGIKDYYFTEKKLKFLFYQSCVYPKWQLI